jgi:PhnB protein
METNPSPDPQRIVPYLAYADAAAAIDFLCRAFGFEEQYRLPMPDGAIGHAEIALAGHVIMLASAFPVMGFLSPRDLSGVHSQVYVRIDEVDTHYERAKAAGATIAVAPRNQHGQRMYRAIDPEGHRWIFAAPSDEESTESTETAHGVEHDD